MTSFRLKRTSGTIFHRVSRDKILHESWNILVALSSGFYVLAAILKVEKALGTRLLSVWMMNVYEITLKRSSLPALCLALSCLSTFVAMLSNGFLITCMNFNGILRAPCISSKMRKFFKSNKSLLVAVPFLSPIACKISKHHFLSLIRYLFLFSPNASVSFHVCYIIWDKVFFF